MPHTTCHMSISLDGFVAGPDQSREHPLGKRGRELHGWHLGDERATDADETAASWLMRPRGALHEFRSRYHDIVDGERIVFAYDLLLDGRLISVSLTTVEVRPDGDGTRLVFTEHGAFFDDLEDPAEREHGTGLLLDGLAAFLGEQVAA